MGRTMSIQLAKFDLEQASLLVKQEAEKQGPLQALRFVCFELLTIDNAIVYKFYFNVRWL